MQLLVFRVTIALVGRNKRVLQEHLCPALAQLEQQLLIVLLVVQAPIQLLALVHACLVHLDLMDQTAVWENACLVLQGRFQWLLDKLILLHAQHALLIDLVYLELQHVHHVLLALFFYQHQLDVHFNH